MAEDKAKLQDEISTLQLKISEIDHELIESKAAAAEALKTFDNEKDELDNQIVSNLAI